MKRKSKSRNARETQSGPVSEMSEVLESTMMGLTPKQVIALKALLAGETKETAAKAANIHRNAIQYWMVHDRYFRTALQIAKVDLFGTFYEALRHGARRAIDVILSIAEDRKIDTGNRLSAAKFLLEKSFATDLTIGPPPIDQDSVDFIPETARCGSELADLDVIQAREALDAKFYSTVTGKRAAAMQRRIARIERQIENLPPDTDNPARCLELLAAKATLQSELSDLERLRRRALRSIPLGRWWSSAQIQEIIEQPSGTEAERSRAANDGEKQSGSLPQQETKMDIALRALNERCLAEQRQAESTMRRPRPRVN